MHCCAPFDKWLADKSSVELVNGNNEMSYMCVICNGECSYAISHAISAISNPFLSHTLLAAIPIANTFEIYW